MKRKLILGIAGVTVLLVAYFFFNGSSEGDSTAITAQVKKGKFKIEIETSGEMEAKNSVKILGPSGLRTFQIWQVNIQKIVDEGTLVKKGDWVASLDRSEFQTKYSQKQIDLEKANSKFIQTQLDTTLIMRQSRDELINLKYAVEEKDIIRQQSKFEPPATIKQTEIDWEKAKRGYQQALENYKIKKNQNSEKMNEVNAELRKVKNEFDGMSLVLESFDVKAPEDGMVIYEKGWDGKPIKAGSQISVWEPTVATLPDLTKMQSKTYVNEVDIRKIKNGQKVDVGLDAYPDKKLKGTVTHVANVGEQRPNSDAKVFEVIVEIEGTDATLRPSMTTSNKIVANEIAESIFIPLECLHSDHDSITYVYRKQRTGIEKQEVVVGETNSNEAIVIAGVKENEELFLSVPIGSENAAINFLPEMNGKRKKKNDDEVKSKPIASAATQLPSVSK